jgi:hypothetical protein
MTVLCVVTWRVLRPTIAIGAPPEVPPELVLTVSDVEMLNRLAGTAGPPPKPAVAHYLLGSAKPWGLSGGEELAAGQPGDLARADQLTDFHLGFHIA